MSIDLWLYDTSKPHSDFPDNVATMKMRELSLFMRTKILASLLGKKADKLVFSTSADGKPHLENNEGLRFNVSHSGTLWGMAVSYDATEIGFDIENERPRKYMSKMMETYFHHKEFLKYKSLPEQLERTAYFYTLWTQKEAYAKYLGLGLKYKFSADAFPAEIPDELNILSGVVLTALPQGSTSYLSLACSALMSPKNLIFLGDTSLNVRITD